MLFCKGSGSYHSKHLNSLLYLLPGLMFCCFFLVLIGVIHATCLLVSCIQAEFQVTFNLFLLTVIGHYLVKLASR